MSRVADQEHLARLACVSRDLHVYLGDQRTGRIKDFKRAAPGFILHRAWHAVGAEYHGGIVGHLGQFLDEYRADRAQAVYYVLVVHDFVPHIDRGAKQCDRAFDDIDGAVHPGAESARISQQYLHQSSAFLPTGHPTKDRRRRR